MFKNYQIYVSIPENKELAENISKSFIKNGGKVLDKFSDGCTHVICREIPQNLEKSGKPFVHVILSSNF